MSSVLNPYLQFKDTAKDALEFYEAALGGELNIMTFGQMGAEGPEAAKVMHGQLETPAGFTLMASDTPEEMEYTPGGNISVCISGDEVEAMHGYFEKLSEGANVTMPLAVQQWGAEFGMLTDKFGVRWMMNINPKQG